MLALGRLVHRYPVLCFQSIITGVSRASGWQNGDSWTPARFDAMLLNNKSLQSRADALCNQYRHVVFPDGSDPPTLNAIPLNLRARPSACKVSKSRVPGGGDGLFATEGLPVGTTWLMGGLPLPGPDRCEMDIYWPEQATNIALRIGLREALRSIDNEYDDVDGVLAWKANEPADQDAPNACYLSSPEGVYMTLCRAVFAGDEILVDYGSDYERDYERSTRYSGRGGSTRAEEDWECVLAVKALLAKRGVHGIEPKQYRKSE
jgi:hypothetical protein